MTGGAPRCDGGNKDSVSPRLVVSPAARGACRKREVQLPVIGLAEVQDEPCRPAPHALDLVPQIFIQVPEHVVQVTIQGVSTLLHQATSASVLVSIHRSHYRSPFSGAHLQ